MSSEDEYDAFYSPIDPTALAEIEDLAPLAPRINSTPSIAIEPNPELIPHHTVPGTPSSPDEFDAYFSGFTAEDFAEIDASIVAAHAALAPPLPTAGPGAASSPAPTTGRGRGRVRRGGRGWRGGRGVGIGGSRVSIIVERAHDSNAHFCAYRVVGRGLSVARTSNFGAIGASYP